jgi:hypothetical protein
MTRAERFHNSPKFSLPVEDVGFHEEISDLLAK